MILIYAEKADMGKKIAAALDCITLPSGKRIQFDELEKYEKQISEAQRQGYFSIRYNGEPCKVTWGSGHVCGLKQAADYNPEYRLWSKLPVPFIPQKYEIMALIGKRNPAADKTRMQRFRELFREADLIINATDFDREGEVIFGYLYEFLKCRKLFKRAHFTSQTKDGIREGFRNLKSAAEIKNMEMSGRARGIADFDIGSNLTAQCTLKFGKRGEVWSVGRVQTATLNFFVNREREIRNFKSEPFWTVQALFTTDAGEQYKGTHTTKRFSTKPEAEEILKKICGRTGTVVEKEILHTKRAVPLLYSLSSLQMDANEQYGYTLDETLKTAQWLYDKEYTTYPRSKSQYLNDDMQSTVTQVLDALEGVSMYEPLISGKSRVYEKRFFDSSKVKSHFAIIPTGKIPTSLTDMQAKIYDLICLSVIRMLYREAKIDKTNIITEVAGEQFASSGSVIMDKGWMAVGDVSVKEEVMPNLSEGDIVRGEYSLGEGKTHPPKRYDDKSIVVAMKTAGKTLENTELKKILEDPEVEGIGTEATRANIIETLIARGYIERKGKQFYATERGEFLIDNLPVEELKSAEITAQWEKRLSNIADGKESYDSFIQDIEEATRTWSLRIKEETVSLKKEDTAASKPTTGLICPLCKKGELVKHDWGWGCSEYNKGSGCKCSFNNKVLGKTISDSAFSDLINKGETRKLSGFVSKRTGKKFDARLILRDNKIGFSFDE